VIEFLFASPNLDRSINIALEVNRVMDLGGIAIACLHHAVVIHDDLMTSNMMVAGSRVV
jgi:tRNA A-37 threonylcarbamoyl transferase component Bud32